MKVIRVLISLAVVTSCLLAVFLTSLPLIETENLPSKMYEVHYSNKKEPSLEKWEQKEVGRIYFYFTRDSKMFTPIGGVVYEQTRSGYKTSIAVEGAIFSFEFPRSVEELKDGEEVRGVFSFKTEDEDAPHSNRKALMKKVLQDNGKIALSMYQSEGMYRMYSVTWIYDKHHSFLLPDSFSQEYRAPFSNVFLVKARVKQ